ncbi:Hypothetical protein I596_909 [Dokdonella koreensis DS-123]|uniref:Uncharacterized protein n=1 Tax=Dokdonella koreensis DS-123 TaxID=1300342 RepID=A0A160DSQ5_9GAMM|nr:Hypothetical protein I596_909 [Dokdonella koreensis DS-123]
MRRQCALRQSRRAPRQRAAGIAAKNGPRACHQSPGRSRWPWKVVRGCCVAPRLTGRQVKPRNARWRLSRANP